MISKEQTKMYYDHYINTILKMYIKNFGTVHWKTPQELSLMIAPDRIPWNKKICDDFVFNSANDTTLLGRDILDRGMYYPFFTIDDHVVLGYHRLYSLKQLKSEKKFLCVELNKEHIDEPLKYNNRKKLGYTFYMEIPLYFKPPEDTNKGEYRILNNDKIVKNNNFMLVKVENYKDLIDLLRITPHWIKNYFYKYKTTPNIVINSREEFEKWIIK